QHRIIGNYDDGIVKIPISDDFTDADAPVEHVWTSIDTFDGIQIQAILVNQPHTVQGFNEDDVMEFEIERVEDWLLFSGDEAFGGFGVNVLRSRMNEDERRGHDDAWGCIFSHRFEPIMPRRSMEFEENVGEMVRAAIKDDPGYSTCECGDGRVPLHHYALHGRTEAAKVLIDSGVDREARCDRGWTAKQYAVVSGICSTIELFD
ncbi:MAG: DUF2314 domain-containing protein, partial [Planctomycetota bacterium]